MSTKEEPGPFDGMERAEPGEPVFTLRAHDVLAPILVHEWVRMRRETIAKADLTEEKRELELIQCREAEEIAWAMVDWREGRRPEEEKPKAQENPNYNGNVSSAEELAAKMRYDCIKGAVTTINNAVSEVTDVAQAIAFYGMENERTVLLSGVERIKVIGQHIAPKRASYSVADPEHVPFDIPAEWRGNADPA